MAIENCLKCDFNRKEPPGARICRKCGRPENVTKREWANGVYVGGIAKWTPSAEDLLGPEEPKWTAEELATADAEATKLHQYFHPEEYGHSPAVEALAEMKAINELPMEVRAAATAALLRNLHPELMDFNRLTTIEPTARPVHSKLGGSSAKRWMNCPGSVDLIARLPKVEEDSEYAAEGTQAHALAAHCLENDLDAWEALANYSLLSYGDVGAIQSYLDYVRSLPGRRDIEVSFHRPELHEDYYGTVDAAVYSVTGGTDIVLEVVDFKFGAGVYVPVVDSEQLLYYAAGYIAGDFGFWPDEGTVRLTVVQPRLDWSGDTIRSWDTTVKAIELWLMDECLPAMNRDRPDEFVMGDWCQFCPAKLVCPAQAEALDEIDNALPPAELEDDALGELFEKCERVQPLRKAVRDEVQRRMMNRGSVPGVKLVAGKADRVWKDEAEARLTYAYKEAAFNKPKLLSPAQAEKLPGGKDFVAEWAYKPEVSPTIALASDPRTAVELPVASQVFSHIDVDSLG